MRYLSIILAMALALTSCVVRKEPPKKATKTARGEAGMAMALSSPAFENGGMIPALYTCDGSDISPPLSWTEIPLDAHSLVIVCDDPDAPGGTWVHWVLFNLHSSTKMLAAGVPGDEKLENGARHGTNDFGKFGYGGPCPPGTEHRYFFKIYALNTMLGITGPIIKSDLFSAMEGHIIAQGELIGRYQRK